MGRVDRKASAFAEETLKKKSVVTDEALEETTTRQSSMPTAWNESEKTSVNTTQQRVER